MTVFINSNILLLKLGVVGLLSWHSIQGTIYRNVAMTTHQDGKYHAESWASLKDSKTLLRTGTDQHHKTGFQPRNLSCKFYTTLHSLIRTKSHTVNHKWRNIPTIFTLKLVSMLSKSHIKFLNQVHKNLKTNDIETLGRWLNIKQIKSILSSMKVKSVFDKHTSSRISKADMSYLGRWHTSSKFQKRSSTAIH